MDIRIRHIHVASPWRGWLAMNHRRYMAYSVGRTGCSGGNLPPSGPPGPESWYIQICNDQTQKRMSFRPSVSGAEESTTLEDEPTQGKACNLGRFLDSLRSLGMTCRGVVPFNRTGCIRNVAGGKVAAPCLSLWERWPSAARTERVYAHGTNGRFHSKTLQGPLSLGYAEPALPEGEPRGGGWFRSTTRVVFVTPRNGTQAVPYDFAGGYIL